VFDIDSTAARIGFGLMLLGAAFIAIGLAIGGPFLGLGAAVFGATAVYGGVHSIATRRHRTGRHGSSALPREHVGATAVTYGLIFTVVGVVMLVAGLAAAFGFGAELWEFVTDRPGPTTVVLGAVFIATGVATAISRWTYVDQSTVWWQRLPGIAVGILLAAIGVGVIAIGRSWANDPPESDEVIERILDTLAGWLGAD
jgi:Flp pilus assembly pilin Flp